MDADLLIPGEEMRSPTCQVIHRLALNPGHDLKVQSVWVNLCSFSPRPQSELLKDCSTLENFYCMQENRRWQESNMIPRFLACEFPAKVAWKTKIFIG